MLSGWREPVQVATTDVPVDLAAPMIIDRRSIPSRRFSGARSTLFTFPATAAMTMSRFAGSSRMIGQISSITSGSGPLGWAEPLS